MTRTTELLKGCGKYLKDTKRQIQKLEENGYTEIHDFSKYPDKLLYSAVIVEKKNKIKLYKAKIKSELRGRLDALKEELSFWEKSGFTEMLLGFPLIKERIASIQEEIKLIEGGI